MKKFSFYFSSSIILGLFLFLATIVSARQNMVAENPMGTLDKFVYLPIVLKPSIPQPKIAFSSGGDIFIVNVDGTGLNNLTNTPSITESEPIWSPDGTKIVYHTGTGGDPHGDKFVMDSDGTNHVNVTNGSYWLYIDIVWSPNSQQLAFRSNRDNYNGGYDIFVVNSDGTGLKNVTNSPISETENMNPHWSPDGSQIVYSEGANSVVKIQSDGTNKTVVFDDTAGFHYFPKWFPDGSKISFIKSKPDPDCLWIMNSDGSNGGCIVTYSELQFAHKYRWNGTGSTQLMIGYDLVDTSWAYLHVVDIDGQEVRKLEQQCSAFASFNWSPDESKAVCEGPGNDIFVINSDGSGVINLTDGLDMNGSDPDFSPVPIQ